MHCILENDYHMKEKQNNLAIIIPAYKATFLAAALDSIASHTNILLKFICNRDFNIQLIENQIVTRI